MKNLALVLAASALFVFCAPSRSHGQSGRVSPLTNQDIISLVKAGLTEDEIVGRIRQRPCSYDTSVAATDEFKRLGVPGNVVVAMLQADCGKKAGESGPVAAEGGALPPANPSV